MFLLGHRWARSSAAPTSSRTAATSPASCSPAPPATPACSARSGSAWPATEARLRGRRHVSALLDKLTFGQYNAAFKPNRTDFDWLSRDEAEVDKYVADPLCGKTFTSGFFADLLGGLARINDRRQVARVRRDLPILLVSGDADPVGARRQGRPGGRRAVRTSVGVTDVTCTLYPDARHEIFNETNRDEVTADV